MWELFERNPILILLLAGWLLSMLGNVLTKSARKAKEAARRQASTTTVERPQRRASTASTEQPDPEEIAAEIRRMMGLEPPTRTRPEPQPPRSEPEPEPEPEQVPHRGHLAEELAQRDRELQARFRSRIEDRARDLGARTRERHFARLPERHSDLEVPRPTRQRRRIASSSAALFDVDDPVRAIVALEVLGPPRALRPWGDGPFGSSA